MNSLARKLRHAAPAILTVFSTVGVVATAVLAVKETPKALQLVENKKDELQKDELTPIELVQTTWKCYIPSALIGVGTISCILGIGVINKRSQAALTSAYAMINESYKQYRQGAKKVYGEDADKKIHAEMAKDSNTYTSDWGYQLYNSEMDPDSEQLLFYDLISKRYFTTTMAAVLNAQYLINRSLAITGECSLNEYLSLIGLEDDEYGNDLGWNVLYLAESYDVCWIDFDNQETILDDGQKCIVIDCLAPCKIG